MKNDKFKAISKARRKRDKAERKFLISGEPDDMFNFLSANDKLSKLYTKRR